MTKDAFGRPVSQSVVSIALFADFLITFGFGVVSWFAPHSTFGTIVAIPEGNGSLVLSLLASVSVFYVLTGFVCLVGARATHPFSSSVAAIMLIRHSWIGTVGVLERDQEWVIGNPYYDIVIHAVFVIAYLIGITLAIRSSRLSELLGDVRVELDNRDART